MESLNVYSLVIDKVQTWSQLVVKNLPNVALALVVLFLFWMLAKIVHSLVQKGFQRTHLNKSLEDLLANMARLAVIFMGFVVALGVVGLDKTVFSLLAGVGVVGFALGFALRDLASNFVSGLYLAISAPIKIGDVIEIAGLQGTVHEIRLRDTVLKNFSGQDILVPNKEFMVSKIENYSTHGKRKVEISFGIDYKDDLAKTSKLVVESLQKIEGVLEDPGIGVKYNDFGASSINLSVYFWIVYPGSDLIRIKNEAISSIKSFVDSGDFNMPYPIQVLEVNSEIQMPSKST